MNEPTRDSVDAQLDRLPREVAPHAHVWSAVSAALVRPRRTVRILPIAAAFVGAVLGGTLVWALLNSRLHAPQLPVPVLADQNVSVGKDFLADPVDPRYVAVRAAMQASYRDRLALLPAQTRGQVEKDLDLIQRAHADIGRALAEHPDSSVLQRLYESTWHEEFDVYERVVLATQASVATT